jgi:hypothetical protein
MDKDILWLDIAVTNAQAINVPECPARQLIHQSSLNLCSPKSSHPN